MTIKILSGILGGFLGLIIGTAIGGFLGIFFGGNFLGSFDIFEHIGIEGYALSTYIVAIIGAIALAIMGVIIALEIVKRRKS